MDLEFIHSNLKECGIYRIYVDFKTRETILTLNLLPTVLHVSEM
jgi:hypothetical protein